jgi:DNA polymerase-4
VVLRLRFDDFTRATRSHTLASSTDNTATIVAAARALLLAATPRIAEAGLTLVGVSLTNLDNADAIQLELPFCTAAALELDQAMDGIKDRFGTAAITRAVLLGRDPGFSVPLLPD